MSEIEVTADQLTFPGIVEPPDEPLMRRAHDVPHARNVDRAPSHLSAAIVEEREGTTTRIKPRTQKHRALYAISLGDCTAAEAEKRTSAYAWYRSGVWKRISDLKNAELVVPAGEKHDDESNRLVTVWAITDLGRSVLAKLERDETVQL